MQRKHYFPLHKALAKRLFDVVIASVLLLVLLLPMLGLSIGVLLTSGFPVVFSSKRTGQYGRPFRMPKFRSMRKDTPLLPTPYFYDAMKHVTPFGSFLRNTSLDELPQLWSVIKGDMSLVGPRPTLFEEELAIHNMRSKHGLYALKPGITGWAQINGRDNITMHSKVRLDCEYLHRQSVLFDATIVLLTIWRIIHQS